jgi:hypothetical protein
VITLLKKVIVCRADIAHIVEVKISQGAKCGNKSQAKK